MSAASEAAPPPPRTRIRAEWWLLGGVVLAVLVTPVHILTAYNNLPAHPLILHVPVVLIPVACIWALIAAFRPRMFEGTGGLWLGIVAVVALIGTSLAIGSGSALRHALHLDVAGGFGDVASLIRRHSHFANLLRIAMGFFTLVLIALLASYRAPLGHAGLDRLLRGNGMRMTLRVLAVVLAVLCGYLVFRVGDLGAQAVWAHRLGGGGFPGGGGFGGGGGGAVNPGGPNQLFGPGGG